ncbi:hypothetical protein CGRA01v4_15097 [Colletotrichum graminicola]|uniref:PD-(D/E)XK nuclease-like domain-containing protein n=1 Tax=Colletotrichum graminicola (strain M1.001 / M2 / FGSC 10212) TaxID=645133 RepID=E3R0X1_COLGM|nr:uncharacterized protein GLRG_11909 [Colletotrichum graminicola M1.001]EFQ36759.1 hypothetical protein GLRG_11909 [Colletotrichum graminicola M1.001]WDK23805.1 hypothetical protein CGRA01v4_15097 [Colletotrichum graminicola]
MHSPSSSPGRPIDITTWLLQIPDDICPEHIHQAHLHHTTKKSLHNRKRLSPLVSPPPSGRTRSFSPDVDGALRANMADISSTPSGKRQKRHHHNAPGSPTDEPLSAADPDATPTQGRRTLDTHKPSLGTRTSTASDHDSRSDVSGQSSPTKRLAAVSLADTPLESREFATGVDTPPAGPALDMFDKMEYLANNTAGLLPWAMRASFHEYAKNGRVPRIDDSAFDASGQRDRLGPTPSVDDVRDILQEALRCQGLVHTEHGWNCSVHFPLLKLALHGAGGRKKQLVDLDLCTHAKPLPAYRSPYTSRPTHMVDFCINLCPRQAGPEYAYAVRAIDLMRTKLPYNSINHTGHNPLLRDPISVSIETKRPAEGEQKQALQVGVWQAAQWQHLEELVRMRLLEAGEPLCTQERCYEVLDQLAFLPAIFVRGHEWSFAATMREGQKTILWREVPMGTTRNVLGIYRIVYAIQLLAEYSRNHFWPWYLRAVLGISTNGDAYEASNLNTTGSR